MRWSLPSFLVFLPLSGCVCTISPQTLDSGTGQIPEFGKC